RSALRSFISCPSSLPSSIFSLPFYCSCPLPALHSFPTRRSSDLLTSLQLAARLAATGRGLRDLAAVMTRLPQVLVNVPGVDKSRSEEHTSELQSRFDLVCRLLLEKKKSKVKMFI